jgi:Tol biopolymer transport system component
MPSWRVIMVVVLVVAVAGALWMAWRRTRPAPELKQQQLTSQTFTDLHAGAATLAGDVEFGSISPDGKKVVFASNGGLRIRDLETGESGAVALPEGFAFNGPFPVMQWFPDGARLVVSGQMADATPAVWVIPTVAGRPRKISSDGSMATVSPDGARVALIRSGKGGPEIWCTDANGESPRHIVSSDSTGAIISWAAWSPRGQRLAYTCQRVDRTRGTVLRLESCDLDGNRRPIPVNTDAFPFWLPDGRLVFSQHDPAPSQFDVNLWSVRVDPRTGATSG